MNLNITGVMDGNSFSLYNDINMTILEGLVSKATIKNRDRLIAALDSLYEDTPSLFTMARCKEMVNMLKTMSFEEKIKSSKVKVVGTIPAKGVQGQRMQQNITVMNEHVVLENLSKEEGPVLSFGRSGQ